ncbi:MAG: histidine phosphatase family protein [Anaerolineae bacterium]|jgi:2,3-bisphosphoglycerate-dependent phosphoglycerate mutase|nr:histidine phosphatase family protein [Anaerolineae bacterium]
MKITFVRHAESHNNYIYYLYRNGRDKYIIDPPLSELGEQQATALADFLAEHREEFNFDQILVSPLQRTLQTAASLTHVYPNTPKSVWLQLVEGGGCRELIQLNPKVVKTGAGLGRSEMMQRFPEVTLPAEVTEDGWYFSDDEEPYTDRIYRGYAVVEQLVEDYGSSEAHIALVSHGEFYDHFVFAILQRTRQEDLRFGIENTGISQFSYTANEAISYDPGFWRIEYMNRHEWLTGDLRRDWSA